MKKANQTGFTLVEVLVSVLVLTAGIIGTAGLQLTALRTAQQTAYQTAAIQLVSDIADKMRANAARFRHDDEFNPFVDLDYDASVDPLPQVAKACHVADCSAEELANFEINEWKSRIKTVLPGGRVRICRDERPWDTVTGRFKWECTPASIDTKISSLVIKVGWHGKGRNPDGSVAAPGDAPASPNLAVTVAPYAQ